MQTADDAWALARADAGVNVGVGGVKCQVKLMMV